MLACLFTVIASGADIGVTVQLDDPVQHVHEAFLCPENIEIMKTYQPLYHLFAVRPGVHTVGRRIHTEVEGRHIQAAIACGTRFPLFHRPRLQEGGQQEDGNKYSYCLFHIFIIY